VLIQSIYLFHTFLGVGTDYFANNINFLVFVVVTRGEIVLCEVESQFEYVIEINVGLRVFKVTRI